MTLAASLSVLPRTTVADEIAPRRVTFQPAPALEIAALAWIPPSGAQTAIVALHPSDSRKEIFGALTVPGYSFGADQAARGRAVFAIDLPGYGESAGSMLTIEGWSLVLDQVVSDLRAGSFAIEGGEPAGYEHVIGAGHSLGGVVVLATQSLFASFDAVIPMGWSHGGASEAGTNCSCFDDCPDRSIRYFHAPEADADVVAEVLALSDQDLAPHSRLSFGFWAAEDCSAGESQRAFSEADFIHVPVLTLLGAEDFFFDRDGMESDASFYRGSTDVTAVLLEATGHHLLHHRNHAAVHSIIADWLAARGF